MSSDLLDVNKKTRPSKNNSSVQIEPWSMLLMTSSAIRSLSEDFRMSVSVMSRKQLTSSSN
jgi:hypothetical protein